MRVRVLVALVLVAIAGLCDAKTFVLEKPLAFSVPSENTELKGFIDKLKTWLKDGKNEKPVIPVLDPYKTDSTELTVNNGVFTLIGNLYNVFTTGLSNFKSKAAEYDAANKKVHVDLVFDMISFVAMYNIQEATLPGMDTMYGKGAVALVAKDVEVIVDVTFDYFPGDTKGFFIKNVNLNVDLKGIVKLNAKGLMGDDTKSTNLSNYIASHLEQMLNDHQDVVSQSGGRALKALLTRSLEGMTYSEFEDMIKAQLDGTLDDVRAIGLSNFDVLKGDFSLIGLKASIRLNWTDIDLMTKYHITKAKLAGDMSLWGTGTIMAVIQGLTVDVDLSISLNGDHKLYVKELDLKVALNTLKFDASGLFDDDETSKILSKVVSELIPQILVDYKEKVSELGGKLVEKVLNEILGKLSIGDLIEMIS